MSLLTNVWAALGINSAIVKQQAELFQQKAWTDLLDTALTEESLGECDTIEKAIKNPLFFKGLAILMVNYMQKVKKRGDERVNDKMFTKEYREKGFLPFFFWLSTSQYDYNTVSDTRLLGEEYIQKVFDPWHNWDFALQLLRKIFKLGKANTISSTRSIFRNDMWALSTQNLGWIIENIIHWKKSESKWEWKVEEHLVTIGATEN